MRRGRPRRYPGGPRLRPSGCRTGPDRSAPVPAAAPTRRPRWAPARARRTRPAIRTPASGPASPPSRVRSLPPASPAARHRRLLRKARGRAARPDQRRLLPRYQPQWPTAAPRRLPRPPADRLRPARPAAKARSNPCRCQPDRALHQVPDRPRRPASARRRRRPIPWRHRHPRTPPAHPARRCPSRPPAALVRQGSPPRWRSVRKTARRLLPPPRAPRLRLPQPPRPQR